MDESLHELETELKGLRLRRPSAGLKQRIALELTERETTGAGRRYTSSTNLGGWKWRGWPLAGLAAVVTMIAAVSWRNLSRDDGGAMRPAPTEPRIVAAVPGTPGAKAAAPARSSDVAATNVLYDLKDEGTVYLEGDRTARRVRYRFLDTYTFRNPRTNASLKWSVPRDEIRVLPAVLN